MQGARASVSTYLYRRTYLRYTGKLASRRKKNWEPNGWLFLKFNGICLCRLISQKCHFLKFVVTWRKKNYAMNFNGRGTKLLQIYSSMVGRVGNIKKKILIILIC